ncbi:hypothetical protein [Roseococcus sp. YIM B11640]|uniref:hypothetical protein n=1 Tax=Roseococcus sp. YIM B11640 TaxID=3133973 RepID=UPI003C7A014F
MAVAPGPAGTSAPILERVAGIVAAAPPRACHPAEFRAFLALEVAGLGDAVRISGAVVE